MNTVLEPTMLFISEAEWSIEAMRDLFLSHLLDNLKAIDDYDITRFYWSDNLECLLWMPPIRPPWRCERDWQNPLVPIIYKLFHNRQIEINNDNCSLIPATCQPPFLKNGPKNDYSNAFLAIMHYLILHNENVYVCLGQPNIAMCRKAITFSCGCHPTALTPVIIGKSTDWYQYINESQITWPTGNNRKGHECLIKAIDIYLKKYFNAYSSNSNSFQITAEFIESLISVVDNQDNILRAIAKRISFTQMQSASDSGLMDEPVHGINNERRFRTSGCSRIHYSYSGPNSIMLLRYYGPGEHDEDLK